MLIARCADDPIDADGHRPRVKTPAFATSAVHLRLLSTNAIIGEQGATWLEILVGPRRANGRADMPNLVEESQVIKGRVTAANGRDSRHDRVDSRRRRRRHRGMSPGLNHLDKELNAQAQRARRVAHEFPEHEAQEQRKAGDDESEWAPQYGRRGSRQGRQVVAQGHTAMTGHPTGYCR